MILDILLYGAIGALSAYLLLNLILYLYLRQMVLSEINTVKKWAEDDNPESHQG